jgi:hypothetical protein
MSKELEKTLSRRTILIAAAGVAPFIALGEAQAAQLPQTAVHFQATPKDGKQCSECSHYVEPNKCQLVAGEIAPTGWCVLFAKKAA